MNATTTDPGAATALAPVDPEIPHLYASRPQALPFDSSLAIRAFLLRRAAGNLLVYSVDGLGSAREQLERLGGVSRQYLNHRHEAMFASGGPGAPLYIHRADEGPVAASLDVRAGFSRRHLLDDDFEVIPTPGHTPGATTYLWRSGGLRVLFTGDSLYLRDGEWVAAVLRSSDRAAYADSLELIRELDFDVLVPWAASSGDPSYALATRAEARRRIDAVLARLRAGENH